LSELNFKMYRNEVTSRGRTAGRSRIARRTLLSAIGTAAALISLPPALVASRPRTGFDWHRLALDVRGEMAWAWRNYVERAFGHDQIKPVSGTAEEFLIPGGPGLGLSIVEALDTLYVMGLDGELEEGVR